MAKKKSTQRRRAGRERNHIATPAERLQATVLCIRDQAKTRPTSSLVGDTPADTIDRCRGIIVALNSGRHGDIVICNKYVLDMVVGALAHAKDETQSLWDAASGVANG